MRIHCGWLSLVLAAALRFFFRSSKSLKSASGVSFISSHLGSGIPIGLASDASPAGVISSYRAASTKWDSDWSKGAELAAIQIGFPLSLISHEI